MFPCFYVISDLCYIAVPNGLWDLAMGENTVSNQNLRMATTSNAVLGHLLALVRRRRHITQAQVAEALGLAGSTWSRVEKGETPITVEQLRVVADKLDVDAATLLVLAEQAEDALRGSGFLIGAGIVSKTESDRAKLGFLGAAVSSVGALAFGNGALPLVGTALGAFLGSNLGSALEKALSGQARSKPAADKD